MSGGYFDYAQYHIPGIIDRIQEAIEGNDVKPEGYPDKYWKGQIYTPETIADFHQCVRLLRIAMAYIKSIDYLLSGDDNEHYYHERLREELKALREKTK